MTYTNMKKRRNKPKRKGPRITFQLDRDVHDELIFILGQLYHGEPEKGKRSRAVREALISWINDHRVAKADGTPPKA